MRPVFGSTFQALALVLSVVVPVSLTAPATAEEEYRDGTPEASPGELAAEAMEKLMKALDLLIGSIPQYEAPYVNENGDIIIRRKHGDGLTVPKDRPVPPTGGPETTTT